MVKNNTLIQCLKIFKLKDIVGFTKLFLTFIPGKIMKLFNRDIWVVSELKENARDNGYWMFKYIRENYPNKKVYYPIKKKSSDYKKVKVLGNVVEFGSMKHFLLFWAASKYLGTTKEHGFPDERTCQFFHLRGLSGFKYIFLNHGVARGYSGIVDGNITRYDLVIAMSESEKETMIKMCNRKPENVVATGFCRHDNLGDDMLDKRLILFMPTWRNWLDFRHETDKATIEDIKNNYLQSEYYKRCNEMVTSKEVVRLLEENDLKLVMYLHGYAQGYSEYFKPASDRIQVAKKEDFFVQDLLKQATYLITDYSSVIFDFAYMKKPCCYYQYDKEEFSKNQYSESEYYTYEDHGFGPIFTELSQILEHIKAAMDKDFKMEEKYLNRVENYFPSFDNKHSERIYEIIDKL